MSLLHINYKVTTLLTAALFLLIPLDYVFPHTGSATVVTLASIGIIVYGFFYIITQKNGRMSFLYGSGSLVILLLVFLLSLSWAINQNVVLSRFVSVANTFILYFVIIQFRFEKESIEIIENASLCGAIILVIWVYKNIDLNLVYAGYRLRFSQLGSDYFSDPNGLCGRIMLPLIIALNRAFYSEKRFHIFFYVSLIISFSYIMFLAGSRASIIAIALAAMIISFQSLEKNKKWILVGIILVLVMFYLFAPRFLPQHITERIFNADKYKEVTEIEGDRVDIWKHIITDLFLSSPFFGYGGGCSPYALAQFYGRTKATHNSYLIVLCETGLIGFLPWMYFIIRQMREAISLRKYSTVLLPATVAVLFVAITLDALTEKYLWSIFIYIHLVGYCYGRNKDYLEQSNIE